MGIEVSERLGGSTARRRARLGVEAWDHIVRVFEDAENSCDGVKGLLDQILGPVRGSRIYQG